MTTIDSVLIFKAPDDHLWDTLSEIGQLFNVVTAEVCQDYQIRRGFSELHDSADISGVALYHMATSLQLPLLEHQADVS
jgi:hypothetical protein